MKKEAKYFKYELEFINLLAKRAVFQIRKNKIEIGRI